ncbi:hypothetical protein C4Q31_15760 [Leptospira borgpetersenii serovar Ceylonica]|nr:hypothetical protein C4Q31_15405 [Leptospira borgpetersenii serovar Ceylonica]AXX16778.1 hypothetical protein C4Q31_15760 [Leptospira borgpetersenii serovar Ceylonica]
MKWMFEAILLIRIMEFFNNSITNLPDRLSLISFKFLETALKLFLPLKWDEVVRFRILHLV